MQAVRFLHKLLSQTLPTVHAKRLNALMDGVRALLRGQRLTLTDLGRSLPSSAHAKHAIKRMDRLLGNSRLQQERALFYRQMIHTLLGSLPHPVILVDWSPINAACTLYLLRAAIPLAGRAFPVFDAVHERDACPELQRQLLNTLAELLPASCVPIIVTDAGFRRPWFQAVAAHGWYYVGRIRHSQLYLNKQDQWVPVKQLYAQATAEARTIGTVKLTRSKPYSVRLDCIHLPPKGRKHRRVTGRIARSKRSRKNAQREREPWLLASNLPESPWSAAQVVSLYRTRMQIEEGFRDLKNPRFGFGLGLHRTRCPRRIEVLLLIAALGCYVLYLAGQHAQTTGQAWHFQSNSIRHRAVLSLWRLGLEYLRRAAPGLPYETLADMQRLLREEVHRQAQPPA